MKDLNTKIASPFTQVVKLSVEEDDKNKIKVCEESANKDQKQGEKILKAASA